MSSVAVLATLLAAISSMVITLLAMFTIGRRFLPVIGASGRGVPEEQPRDELDITLGEGDHRRRRP